jgi:hypothetical protein
MPISEDTIFGGVFDVPGLPTNTTVWNNGVCYYIYVNIFMPNGVPAGSIYNQFVPQLMLGDALSGSSGPPFYAPVWNTFQTYNFQAQYFFALGDDGPSGNITLYAVTGDTFGAEPGESLWTEFSLGSDWAWTLRMGVVGDPSRTSVVVAPTPFMGLLPGTTSWSEPAYNTTHLNACWELYGTDSRSAYPSNGSTFSMSTVIEGGGPSIAWSTDWNNAPVPPNCSGHPSATATTEVHSPTSQNVTWGVYWP